jgi:hypothetical protein
MSYKHYLSYTLIFLLLLAISCKKEVEAPPLSESQNGIQQNFRHLNWTGREATFFDLNRKTGTGSRNLDKSNGIYHPLLVEAYNKLADDNAREGFVDAISKKGGYPLWKDAIIYKDDVSKTNFISIPLALEGSQEITSYISMLKSDDGSFVINGITRPDMLSTDRGDPRVKENRAKLMAIFDSKLYDTVKSNLLDAICSYTNGQGSNEGGGNNGGSNPPPTPPLVFCRYIPVYVCMNGGNLIYNSHVGILPIHLDHDMDGVPNQDDTDWQELLTRTGRSHNDLQNILQDRIEDLWDNDKFGGHEYDDFFNPEINLDIDSNNPDIFENLIEILEYIEQFIDRDIDPGPDPDPDPDPGSNNCCAYNEWDDFDCDRGGLTGGEASDRELICGTVYLLACGGEENSQEWWERMVEELENSAVPDDFRPYISQYHTDNGLQNLIDFDVLTYIVAGATGQASQCYPQASGFTECIDDKLHTYIINALHLNQTTLSPDHVQLLQGNRELLAVIANYIYYNEATNPQAVVTSIPQVLELVQELGISIAQVQWLLQPNNGQILSHIVDVKENIVVQDQESIDIAVNVYLTQHMADPSFRELEAEMANWPGWVWEIATEILVEIGARIVKKQLGLTIGDDVKALISSCGSGDYLTCFTKTVDVLRNAFPTLKILDTSIDFIENSFVAKRYFDALTWIQGLGEQAVKRAWDIFQKIPIPSFLDVQDPFSYLRYIHDTGTPNLGGYFATVNTYSSNYKTKFPEVASQISQVHHAVPQAVISRYPTLGINQTQMHSLENLRGIPNNGTVSHQAITNSWNQFYATHPAATTTLEQILNKAKEIDNEFGHLFVPPIR